MTAPAFSAGRPPVMVRVARMQAMIARWHIRWGDLGLLGVLTSFSWYFSSNSPMASLEALIGITVIFISLAYISVRVQAEATDRSRAKSKRVLNQLSTWRKKDQEELRAHIRAPEKRIDEARRKAHEAWEEERNQRTNALKKLRERQEANQAQCLMLLSTKPCQSFKRRLSPPDIERLLHTWCAKLGVASSAAHLRYLQQRICFLEDQCLVRLAGHVRDAILRVLIGLSCKHKKIKFLEIGILFGVNAIPFYNILTCYGFDVYLTMIDPLQGYHGQGLNSGTGLPVSREILERNLGRSGIPLDHCRIIQAFSTEPEALRAVGNDRFDIVFIDGDHSSTFALMRPVRPHGLTTSRCFGYPGR